MDTVKYNELRDPLGQVHINFFKQLLGVNIACRAELGRFPINVEVKAKSISFWARLLTLDDNRIAKKLDIITETSQHQKLGNGNQRNIIP